MQSDSLCSHIWILSEKHWEECDVISIKPFLYFQFRMLPSINVSDLRSIKNIIICSTDFYDFGSGALQTKPWRQQVQRCCSTASLKWRHYCKLKITDQQHPQPGHQRLLAWQVQSAKQSSLSSHWACKTKIEPTFSHRFFFFFNSHMSYIHAQAWHQPVKHVGNVQMGKK